MFPTLLGAAVLVFFMLRLIPGDVCELRMAGTGMYVDKEAIATCQQNLGINAPIYVQFVDFITGFFTFDLGNSMWTGKPILHEIGLRFELSLQVAIMATLTATIIAIPLGTISAIKQGHLDRLRRALVQHRGHRHAPPSGLGILIILGLLIMTQKFFGNPWMPPIHYTPIWEDPVANISQLIWPAVATGYRYSAVATRMTRSAPAGGSAGGLRAHRPRAKGLLEKLIINRHALKNSLLPVATIIGLEFAFLMGGLVVTEQVFNLNGLGKLFVESVTNHDYTMTQSLVMLVAVVFILTNLFIDILYAWLDPRIRYS